MKKKGQNALEALIGAAIILIFLLVTFAMLDPIIGELFNTLQGMNSEEVSSITAIQTLIGLIPLILTALAIAVIARSVLRGRSGPPQQGVV